MRWFGFRWCVGCVFLLFRLYCRRFSDGFVRFGFFGSTAYFFRFAPLCCQTLLFGTFSGKAFFLVFTPVVRFSGRCFRDRNSQTDDDEITVGGMVLGDRAR